LTSHGCIARRFSTVGLLFAQTIATFFLLIIAVFEAGSYYNVYLQIVRRRGVQLGAYLQRQSMIGPPPFPSIPPDSPVAPPTRLTRYASSLGSDIRPYPMSTPMPSAPLSIRSLSSPFVDRRKKLWAYFSIHCHNMSGTALTRFESGPALFKNSQSWGWKSTALRSEEYIGNAASLFSDENAIGIDGRPTTAGNAPPNPAVEKYQSLRSVFISLSSHC
jgi:hypothetical protein